MSFLRRRFYQSSAALAPNVAAFTTWNPSDKGANYTLSNNNLTATLGANSLEGVRAIKDISGLKCCWEISGSGWPVSTNANVLIGIAKSTAALTYPGDDANGWGWYGVNGAILVNDVQTGSTIGTYVAANSPLGIAFDGPAGKLYFNKGGVWQNGSDPAAGTNASVTGLTVGPYYPMVGPGTGTASGSVFIGNFGGATFGFALPTGFTGVTV